MPGGNDDLWLLCAQKLGNESGFRMHSVVYIFDI